MNNEDVPVFDAFEYEKIGVVDDLRYRWAAPVGFYDWKDPVPFSEISVDECECARILLGDGRRETTFTFVKLTRGVCRGGSGKYLAPLTTKQLVEASHSLVSASLQTIAADGTLSAGTREAAIKIRTAFDSHVDAMVTPSFDEIGLFAYAKAVEDKYDLNKRIKAKFGKVVYRFLTEADVPAPEVGRIQHVLFQKIWPIKYLNEEDVKILYGDDLVEAYKNGPRSCMSRGNTLHLYSHNPDVIGLVVYSPTKNFLKSPKARALLWSAKHPETGETVEILDRVYPNEGPLNAKIRAWAKRRGCVIRGCDEAGDVALYKDGVKLARPFHVELKWPRPVSTNPYVDTFRYVTSWDPGKKLVVTNDRACSRVATLTSTGGAPMNEYSECLECGKFDRGISEHLIGAKRITACKKCIEAKYFNCKAHCRYEPLSEKIPLNGGGFSCAEGLAALGMITCADCGVAFRTSGVIRPDDSGISRCFACCELSGVTQCSRCRLHFEFGTTEFGDERMCEKCLEVETFTCTDCGTRMYRKFEASGERCVDCAAEAAPKPKSKRKSGAGFSLALFR